MIDQEADTEACTPDVYENVLCICMYMSVCVCACTCTYVHVCINLIYLCLCCFSFIKFKDNGITITFLLFINQVVVVKITTLPTGNIVS